MGGAAIGVAVAAVARARAVAQRLAGQRGEDGRGGGVVQEEPAAVAAVVAAGYDGGGGHEDDGDYLHPPVSYRPTTRWSTKKKRKKLHLAFKRILFLITLTTPRGEENGPFFPKKSGQLGKNNI